MSIQHWSCISICSAVVLFTRCTPTLGSGYRRNHSLRTWWCEVRTFRSSRVRTSPYRHKSDLHIWHRRGDSKTGSQRGCLPMSRCSRVTGVTDLDLKGFTIQGSRVAVGSVGIKVSGSRPVPHLPQSERWKSSVNRYWPPSPLRTPIPPRAGSAYVMDLAANSDSQNSSTVPIVGREAPALIPTPMRQHAYRHPGALYGESFEIEIGHPRRREHRDIGGLPRWLPVFESPPPVPNVKFTFMPVSR